MAIGKDLPALCTDCENEHPPARCHNSVGRGVTLGMNRERSCIVEWLRSFEVIRGGALTADEDAAHEALLTVVADAIERGDHVSWEPNR